MEKIMGCSNYMFSVLMSVYKKEDPAYLGGCLESLMQQTLLPDEIILVRDGALTSELDAVINEYLVKYNIIKIISLEANVGLGEALRIGVQHCSFDLIARMDTDDLARPDRFERQIEYLRNNPDIDIVGSWIQEFESNPCCPIQSRILPTYHNEIVRYAKKRNPFNHMTVIFKKKSILSAGSYKAMYGCEDYYLWVRMILNGSRLANLPEYLVSARIGNGMIERRGGINYLKYEWKLQRLFYKIGFLNILEFSFNVVVRILVRISPTWLRTLFYKEILRAIV